MVEENHKNTLKIAVKQAVIFTLLVSSIILLTVSIVGQNILQFIAGVYMFGMSIDMCSLINTEDINFKQIFKSILKREKK